MLFENILRLHDLPGIPSFRPFELDDINPLSGSRKQRVLYDPNPAMRTLHRRFLIWLRSRWISLPCATGARKGASPVRNVQRHQSQRYFCLLDIESAYWNVDGKKLAQVICSFDERLQGREAEVQDFLSRHFLHCLAGGLITGAPASPEIYNHYAGALLDRDLRALCRRFGLIYTRYLDDITISSQSEPIGKRKRRAIRDLIINAGFPLNHAKSKVCDLKKQPLVITGVGLEWPGRIFLPRRYLRRLRGVLHRAVRHGNISRSKLNGMMGVFWAATDPGRLNAAERKITQCYQEALAIKPSQPVKI